jgi:Replication initiator protein, pSAM2
VTEPAGKTTRAQRMTMPLAREVVKDLAVEHGACIRPIQLRRTNLDTGETDTVLVPCGHTLANVCPSCAERAKSLRTAQCREGWHLEDEPRFAAIEPQRRLAPHVHIAMRGTVSRAELRRVLAATYHQVWWPNATEVKYDGDEQPVWDESTGTYLDPATGEVLPTWDQALDAISDEDEPWHVARFGIRFDAQGVLAGSKDAGRCIGYLTKYLTKQVGDCHQADTDSQQAHAARLAEALRFQPCSPTCANWLRYGIQPKNARPGLAPGLCEGKAHDADHLGYAGRRVLVSRKWSGKTLADHRADRKDWLLKTLGVSATDPARYAWEPVAPGDPDHMDHARRLLHAVADRARWQAALTEARRRAEDSAIPSVGRAALWRISATNS